MEHVAENRHNDVRAGLACGDRHRRRFRLGVVGSRGGVAAERERCRHRQAADLRQADGESHVRAG